MQWLAIPLLFATPLVADLSAQRGFRVTVGLLLCVLGAQAIAQLPPRLEMIARAIAGSASAIDGQRHIDARRTFWQYAGENLRNGGTVFDPALSKSIRGSPLARVAAQIERARREVSASELAVFIPPENGAFWRPPHALSFSCMNPPFWIPMLTGVPMLKGLTPDCPDLGFLRGYGVGGYGPESRSQSIGDSELCQHAATRGIQSVFVLRSMDVSEMNRTLDCAVRANSANDRTAP